VRNDVPSETDFAGLRLDDRYQLDERLAGGALSAVYRGQDTVLRRSIAVKAVSPAAVDAYRAALHDTAALTHPAAVATYDAIERDGWLFLVQEYVPARPLSAYLAAGVPAERAIDLGGQIARALAYAHGRDIAHGDLTPAAVLVDRQAQVRVNNFCLPADDAYFAACASQWDESRAFEPPETWRTPAGDVMALGLLLWQLLTQPVRPALSATEEPLVERRAFRRDVPEAVRDVVRRCVGAEHPERFSDMSAVVTALEVVAAELAKDRTRAAEETPPALRAARAAVLQEAAWSVEATLGGIRPWAPGADEAPAVAAVDPYPPGIAPWHVEPTDVLPPRLRLPSRPIGGDSAVQTLAAHARSSRETGRPLFEGDGITAQGASLRWKLILAVGLALFVLFFLIGYFVPPLLGRGG
jgi:hypothetical protein